MRVRTLRDQAFLFLSSFMLLIVALLVLYALGAPAVRKVPDNAWIAISEAVSYFFPCVAALVAGLGAVVGFHGRTEHKRTRPSSHRLERRLYLMSMLFLYGGVLGYVGAHACRWPGLTLSLVCEITSCAAVLFAGRSRWRQRSKTVAFWTHFWRDFLVLVVFLAVATGIVAFFLPGVFFESGHCAV
jgi:predicted small integral membrane protein